MESTTDFRTRLAELVPARRRKPEREVPTTRVITVRMPRELHELLRTLAHAERMSMNQLCVAGLTAAACELAEHPTQQALAAS